MITQFISERELNPQMKKEFVYMGEMRVNEGRLYRGYGTNLVFSEDKRRVSIAGDEKDIRKIARELTDLFKTKLTPIGN